jgi:uncharacterized protein
MDHPYEEITRLLATHPAAAVSRLRTYAQGGDAQAQLALGQLLINGVGSRLDVREALGWFRAAADAGVPMAINMLGRCHEYGFGVPVDYLQAASCYLRAAQLDCDWAMYNYAQMLAHGRGMERDRAAALIWFRLAASRGHARAMNFMGMYCENGWETARDPDAAFSWYRQSAEGGDFRGQCSYASALAEQGRVDEALMWLQRATTTATPRFLAELATVLKQSPHAALRNFADELQRSATQLKRHTSDQNRSKL